MQELLLFKNISCYLETGPGNVINLVHYWKQVMSTISLYIKIRIKYSCCHICRSGSPIAKYRFLGPVPNPLNQNPSSS